MNELVEYAQLLMSFLQDQGPRLNVESQQAVASMLQSVLQIIEQQGQAGTPPNEPTQITPSMPSSNVEGFSYDPENKKLLIRFHGEFPNRDGPIYSYDDVPPVVFQMVQRGAVPASTNGQNKWGKWWKGKSPSVGASVYNMIRMQGYNYRRVA